jgi:hypothetical protein
MTKTIEFVYHLLCVAMLIAALHIADVRPWAERMAVIGWPILIAVSVWFIAGICRRCVVGEMIGANDAFCRHLRLVHGEGGEYRQAA